MPLPPDLPKAVLANAEELSFHVSPLLRSGHLSAQVRQSLNELLRETHGQTTVKLRAFVAGPGDARAVGSEVTQVFGEHRLLLPALSVMRVGALPTPGSQVVIEAVTAASGKQLNPEGLAFASGQRAANLDAALEKLANGMKEAWLPLDNVLSVTCFVPTLEHLDAVRSRFPQAAINVMQPLRDPIDESTTCEGVGRLGPPPLTDAPPLLLLGRSRVARVTDPQLIFTGMQLSFGNFLDDAEEAVSRLQRTAAALAPTAATVQVDAFAYDSASGAALRKRATVPRSTLTVQIVEGLPGADATAGIEAILAAGIKDSTPVER
ncbi:MAG: RidA family protein [Rhodospirillales bacterium]|nr:RidA family protein [Acetobacter sp.]